MDNDTRRVLVVGAGGVGFWTTVGLAASGIKPVVVFDDDDLQGGLGYTRLPRARPTTRKIDLLRGFLRVNFSGELPEFVGAKFTGKEADAGDLVVDCTDMSGAARRKVWAVAEKRKARLLRVSYDGEQSIIVVAEGLPLTGNENAAGYAHVPSLSLSLAAGGVAAEIVARMVEADLAVDHVEFQLTLGEFVTRREQINTAKMLEEIMA